MPSLSNQPIGIPRLDYGQRVKFTRGDVIDISYEGDEQTTVIDGECSCLVEPSCPACNGPDRDQGSATP